MQHGCALIELLCSLTGHNSFFANPTLSIIFFPLLFILAYLKLDDQLSQAGTCPCL